MAREVTAKFENRAAVMARLAAIVPELERRMAESELRLGDELAERVKPRAPIRSGKYRASIRSGRLRDNPNKGGSRVALQTKDQNAVGLYANFRWRWLEFGTVKMPARPHILPTYRAFRPVIRKRMAGVVNRAVKKFIKSKGTASG